VLAGALAAVSAVLAGRQSTRAGRESRRAREQAREQRVDAAAYTRAQEILEAVIETLNEHRVHDLAEIRRLEALLEQRTAACARCFDERTRLRDQLRGKPQPPSRHGQGRS
jgi:serine/threonine protein kinase HipA of HipAB toxin-antitoxin module